MPPERETIRTWEGWNGIKKIIEHQARAVVELSAKEKITELLVAFVLKGGVPYSTELSFAIGSINPELVLLPVHVRTSSYGKKYQGSDDFPVIFLDVDVPNFDGLTNSELTGKHWLVPDDIGDRFRTQARICDEIRKRWNPASIHSTVLCRRADARVPSAVKLLPMTPDHQIVIEPSLWAEGMGMTDASYKYWNLRSIRAFKKPTPISKSSCSCCPVHLPAGFDV